MKLFKYLVLIVGIILSSIFIPKWIKGRLAKP